MGHLHVNTVSIFIHRIKGQAEEETHAVDSFTLFDNFVYWLMIYLVNNKCPVFFLLFEKAVCFSAVDNSTYEHSFHECL